MARIFVSSAFDEMRKFRDLAAEIIRLAGHEPVTLEHRGADPRPPEIYCAEQVGRCDGFVMLLGHLYGSVDKDQNVSFTEWEHRAAVERRLKRLVFELKLSDDDYLIHQIQRSVLERKTKFEPGTTDWKYERQIQFKGDVRKGVTTRPFESEHEFERLLQQALQPFAIDGRVPVHQVQVVVPGEAAVGVVAFGHARSLPRWTRNSEA